MFRSLHICSRRNENKVFSFLGEALILKSDGCREERHLYFRHCGCSSLSQKELLIQSKVGSLATILLSPQMAAATLESNQEQVISSTMEELS